MLGFSKMFVICLIISAAIAYGTKNIWNGVSIMAMFAVSRIIWRFLTR